MNINEANKKINTLEKKKELLENYLKIGFDVEVLEIEEAIKSYKKEIEELLIFIEKNK